MGDTAAGAGFTLGGLKPTPTPEVETETVIAREPEAEVVLPIPETSDSVVEVKEEVKAPEPTPTPEESSIIYTSHPIEKFGVGPKYKFNRGQLILTPTEAAEFDALLAKMDPKTRATVRKIDTATADAIIANWRRNMATKSIDSADPVQQLGTLIGTEALK